MDAERARQIMLALPHVVETMQWGDNLVFWAGDKAIGGKMFALVTLDGRDLVISFAAGPEHAAELCEQEGFRPAPYFARLHWVAAERWDVLPARAWQQELAAAHAIVSGKLPKKVQAALQLPPKQLAALIAERRRERAAASPGKRPRAKSVKAQQAALD